MTLEVKLENPREGCSLQWSTMVKSNANEREIFGILVVRSLHELLMILHVELLVLWFGV